jgi:tetratricopeptide (TPR) repeat protein
MMGKGFAYAEQHFRKVSKTVGWQLALPQGVINEFAYEALAQGKTQEAIGLFKRNVEASPNSADAWGSLADGYAKAGSWKDAVQASERAVAVATEFARPNLSYFVGQAKKMNQQRNQVTAPSQ